VINYANKQYGGQLAASDVRTATILLNGLNWNVLGEDGKPETTASANGVNEIRIGQESYRSEARRLALDLNAAGYPVKPEPVKIKNAADGQVEVWLSEPRRDLWLAAPPVAGWCFQRLGQETPNGRHSLRCHKDPKTCQTVRDASPGEMSSSCTFVAFIDKTGVQFQGTGTENSYYLYAKMPFASPFPSLP